MPACKECGVAFTWGLRIGKKPGDKGAFVRLHPDADPIGIWTLVDRRAVLWDPQQHAELPRYVPHEIYCANAGRYRGADA